MQKSLCTYIQWARIVLMMELSVTPSHRLQQQMKYSQPMDGNKRAFVVRWHQTVSYCIQVFSSKFVIGSIIFLLVT